MTDSKIIDKLKERIESLEKRVTELEDPSSPNLTTHYSLESKILEKIDLGLI